MQGKSSYQENNYSTIKQTKKSLLEEGIQLWLQLFGKVQETDIFTFKEKFGEFIKKQANYLLDDNQFSIMFKKMDPKCLQIVELPKFLYFYETTWGIPSQRLSIMNHKFSLPEEVHIDSTNECLQLTVIKSPSRTISLLQKQAIIKFYQTHIEIQNGSQQYLKQISQCIFGTDQEKCDIVFPWTSDISPQHLKIGQSSQGYWIKDISKLNRSVFVMQKNQQYQLQGNSVIQFGLDDRFLISYVRPIFTPDSQQYRDATQAKQQELYSDFNLDQNLNKEGSDSDNNESSNQNQGFKSKQNKTFYFDPDVKDLENTLKKYKEIKFNNSYIQKSNVKNIEKNNDFSDDDYDLAMINQKGPLLRMKGLSGQYKDQILEFDQGIYTFGTDETNKFVFNNPSVSKKQCKIQYTNDLGWVIKQEQETFGNFIYFVNYNYFQEKLPSKQIPLQDQMVFKIGDYQFRIDIIKKNEF